MMHRARPIAALVGLALALGAGAGCRKAIPPATDLEQARVALTVALDAWKQGQAPEALQAKSPPIDFRDPQWEQGRRLTRYEVKQEEVAGLSARFTVRLSVEAPGGAARERIVTYSADTGAGIVIRPDF